MTVHTLVFVAMMESDANKLCQEPLCARCLPSRGLLRCAGDVVSTGHRQLLKEGTRRRTHVRKLNAMSAIVNACRTDAMVRWDMVLRMGHVGSYVRTCTPACPQSGCVRTNCEILFGSQRIKLSHSHHHLTNKLSSHKFCQLAGGVHLLHDVSPSNEFALHENLLGVRRRGGS